MHGQKQLEWTRYQPFRLISTPAPDMAVFQKLKIYLGFTAQVKGEVYVKMATPPGQFIALQAINVLKETIWV